ncbi:hypothetical protein [Parablautia sp. Marseille-Q6255]|uniref:hypothetical protein n=1 Tax=Parablautia sp. Marseille-Q6255 TaxID=3039593 RepID=UPI0024BBF9B8|nr:hypothetical protein [Parablautia sp. Marseille-Q6255]
MEKPRIISEIRVNGVLTRQEDIPPDIAHQVIAQTIIRAAANIGFKATRKEKTA